MQQHYLISHLKHWLQTLAEFQSGEGQVVEHVDGVGEDYSFVSVEQTVEPRPATNINTVTL